MPGIQRKLVIITGVFLGLVAILVVCGLLYLETAPVQEMFQRAINTRIAGDLTWERMGVSPFTGSVELEALRLRGPDKKPLARVKRVKVGMAFSRLLRGEIAFSSILIEAPDLTIETDVKGSLNLAKAFQGPDAAARNPEGSAGPLPFNVTIDKLVVVDGAVNYRLPGEKKSISVSGLELLISDADLAGKKAVLTAEIKNGFINSPGICPPIQSFKTSMVFSDGSFPSFFLDLAGGATRLKAQGSVKDLFKTPVLDLTMDAQVAMQEVSNFFTHRTVVTGTAGIHVSAKGSIENPEIDIKAECGKSVIQGQPVDKIDIELALKNRNIRLISSRVTLPAGQLTLKGDADLTDVFPEGFLSPNNNFDLLSYTLFIEQEKRRLSTLFPALPGISGSIASRIRLDGKGINPDHLTANLVLEMAATDVKTDVPDVPVDVEIKAVAGFENKKLGLTSFTASARGMDISGQGEVDIGSGQVAATLALKMNDLGAAPGLAHLKGTGDVSLSAGLVGSYLAPEIKLDLMSNNLGIQDVFLGDLSLKAFLDSKGRVFIDLLTLENQGSGIEATGWADLFEGNLNFSNTLPADIRCAFDDLELSHFSSRPGLKGSFSGTSRVSGSLLDPEFQVSLTKGSLSLADFSEQMKGRLSVNGSLKGSVKGSPDDWQGNLDIGGSTLLLGGQTIDTVSLKTVIEGQTLWIEDGDIQVAPEAVLKAKGWASFTDRQFDLGLSGKAFPLKSLDIFRDTVLTGGRMALDLSCTGTVETPVISSRIVIQDVAIKDKPVDDMELSIETKNGIARLKGRMGVLFESEVRFDDKRFFARVDMDGFDPGPYFTAAGQDSLSGRLNGSITANGRLDDLPMTRVRADLKNSSLGFNRDELITIPSLTLSLTDGRFSIPESGITILGEEKITIKGDGELKGGIHFELKGMIPFKAAAPVFDTVSDASGDIMVWALMEGTLSEPSLTASLTLERLGMSVSGIEQKFKDIDGTIKITPDRIHILQFTGGLDDGRFDLSGNIGLNKLKPDTYHLSFNARQLFLEFPDLMDIHLNADLSLSGDTDRSDLKGEIVVIEGRYFKKIELDLTDVAAKKREIQPIQEKPDIPFLKKMALNIDIRHREPFWVDNNLALLSVLPDLKLAGTAADPLITGRARVDSGTITFQKKEFDIKKGIIDFINPYKIEPLIDMEATLDVRSWTLYLTVSGTPDNLDFNFSSIPQEQHADILSLLAFGKTTRELRRADGGSAFSPDAILAEFVTGMLQENIKEASGIDTLEIKPDHLDNNGTPGINVVVGKELSRQMTVKYGVDVRNGETVQRMTTDYKLLENLLMRGFQDTGGHFGGELTYRLEFR